MSSYTITLNDRTTQGQALLAYLRMLNVELIPLPKVRRKSGIECSEDDIRAGRVQSFANADEMCNALGI